MNNKVSVYTNTTAPANHLYISSPISSINLFLNISNSFNPLDITGINRNSYINLDIIHAERFALAHMLTSSNKLSLVSEGLL